MSQDVCPVIRAGAIVEPAGTWGDSAVRSELGCKLLPQGADYGGQP
jgi:hypothetical protein